VIPFRECWACDFEFRADPGERPWLVCMVAHELRTGREIRLWRSELLNLRTAPFNVGTDAVFVAYYASAELGCFLELGWPLPVNVVDLFVEHRCETNGVPTTCGDGLVGALALRGLAHIDAGEKEAMRRWAPMVATDVCCLRFAPSPGAISPAIPGSSSARRGGCAV
jgi:DNA polymerase-1